MADAFEGILGLVPVVLGTGLVLGTLGLVENLAGPSRTEEKPGMAYWQTKSLQDMI